MLRAPDAVRRKSERWLVAREVPARTDETNGS